MPQNRETGAEGNRFGREYGERITAALGGKLLRSGSNECILDGRRVSLHCAGVRTTSVGVLYDMLERIDAVIAAFQQDDGSFRVFQLALQQYKENMRPTGSGGASARKVGLVTRAVFEREGRLVGVVRV